MPDLLDQFVQETIAEILKKLPAEERLKGLPAEERLKGVPVDELLNALSPEMRDELARRLKDKDEPSNPGAES